MNVLEVSSLWKTYEGASPYTALEDVSLNVAKGEFVGIMGFGQRKKHAAQRGFDR